MQEWSPPGQPELFNAPDSNEMSQVRDAFQARQEQIDAVLAANPTLPPSPRQVAEQRRREAEEVARRAAAAQQHTTWTAAPSPAGQQQRQGYSGGPQPGQRTAQAPAPGQAGTQQNASSGSQRKYTAQGGWEEPTQRQQQPAPGPVGQPLGARQRAAQAAHQNTAPGSGPVGRQYGQPPQPQQQGYAGHSRGPQPGQYAGPAPGYNDNSAPAGTKKEFGPLPLEKLGLSTQPFEDPYVLHREYYGMYTTLARQSYDPKDYLGYAIRENNSRTIQDYAPDLLEDFALDVNRQGYMHAVSASDRGSNRNQAIGDSIHRLGTELTYNKATGRYEHLRCPTIALVEGSDPSIVNGLVQKTDYASHKVSTVGELVAILVRANDKAADYSSRQGELSNGHVACITAAVQGNKYMIASVGNGHAYIVDKDGARRLALMNTDHQVPGALGTNTLSWDQVGVAEGSLEPGQKLLVCSASLGKALSPDRIAQMLMSADDDTPEATRRLIAAYLQTGALEKVHAAVIEPQDLTSDMVEDFTRLDALVAATERTLKKLTNSNGGELAKALVDADKKYNRAGKHDLSAIIRSAISEGYINPRENEPVWHMPEEDGKSVKAFVKAWIQGRR